MPNHILFQMRNFIFLCFLILPLSVFSQQKITNLLGFDSKYNSTDSINKKKEKVATIDMYRVITLERDTTYIDTSLTIKKLYSFNYLRKDNFGLLPFPNEGQTYNTLQYSLNTFSPLPEFGFKAKHFNFLEANQIRYSSVATPVTELYFKSVMKQGQNVDAFFTLNMTPRLNLSIAYKGLRSEGRYVNQMSSTGNFRFTASYNTKNKRYFANTHFVSQDILNEENGGIKNAEDFETGDPAFVNRDRLEVYLTDARSFLKGKRLFLDHFFRVNPNEGKNNLYVNHQFNYENKFFEFNQPTVGISDLRYGESYKTNGINDQTRYNKTYNKVGLTYENLTLGKFQFFVDDFFHNYYYNQILILNANTIPSSVSQRINSVGGQYEYRKNKWNGKFLLSRSVTNQSLSDLEAKMQYDWNEEVQFSFQYQNMNKLPNVNYNLYQSSYVNYNWSEDFKNEKINSISVNAITPFVEASVQYSTFKDHLYFNDVTNTAQQTLNQQIVKPAQYGGVINYLSVKASKEFTFWKLALDNTVLYQKVDQSDAILNVPELVTRNTLYFSQEMFHKALFFQTGVTFNYFTKYYANEYNPIIGEFFVQNKKEIGDFANFDFFFNAKIQRTRVYVIAEHFNSSLSGYNYFSSPNTPYRDFMIRVGVIWNFFQ